jgi:hypothetical protein
MIRRFNYTGRQKIKRSSVQVDVTRNGEGVHFFNISLNLDDLDIPDASTLKPTTDQDISVLILDLLEKGEFRQIGD